MAESGYLIPIEWAELLDPDGRIQEGMTRAAEYSSDPFTYPDPVYKALRHVDGVHFMGWPDA